MISVEEVFDLVMAAPRPGLKYRAALCISYGAGLRAAEVCNLKLDDIYCDRMFLDVERGKGLKDRKVMLSPSLLELLCAWWFEARPRVDYCTLMTPEEHGYAILLKGDLAGILALAAGKLR